MKERPIITNTDFIKQRIKGLHDLGMDRDDALEAYQNLLTNWRDEFHLTAEQIYMLDGEFIRTFSELKK